MKGLVKVPMRRSLPLLLALCVPALARAELVDRVAAVVNNDVVTLREVEQRAAPLLEQLDREPPGDQRTKDRDEAMRRALDDLIGEKLMDSELKGMNVDVTDQEVDLAIDDVKKQNNITDPDAFAAALKQQGFTLSTYRDFMKKQLAKVKLLNIKVKSKVKISDEDVKAEYARMAHSDTQDVEIHARHIIILCPQNAPPEKVEATHKKALEVMELAKKPGADFAALARKYSEGSGASSGGDLGWFRRGTLAASFENAAFALKKGEVSQPVRTAFGWHVIKLEDTRHAAPRPFDEVKDSIREKLYRDQIEKQTESYVVELRRNAVVEVKLPELRHTDPKDPLTPPSDSSMVAGAGKDTVISGPGMQPKSVLPPDGTQGVGGAGSNPGMPGMP